MQPKYFTAKLAKTAKCSWALTHPCTTKIGPRVLSSVPVNIGLGESSVPGWTIPEARPPSGSTLLLGAGFQLPIG